METDQLYTAFQRHDHVATGTLAAVLARVHDVLRGDPGAQILVFDDETGKQVDFDMRGTIDEVLARVTPAVAPRGPGRPSLGVVSREVSLLPRHWEWLEAQPARASGTLRRLVDEARRNEAGDGRARRRIETAGRFMWSMAGNLEGFEEASRALYARQWPVFDERIARWPEDVKRHLVRLLRPARDAAA
jgi:uncharacterized protein